MHDDTHADGEFRALHKPGFEQKLARLREIAARMFVERGVAHTSLDDVGRGAGAAGWPRHVYARKDALLADIVNDHATRLVAAVQAASETPGPRAARLAAIARAYLQAACQARAEHLLLCHQRHEMSAALRADLAVRDGWLRLPIEDLLAAIRPGDAAPRQAICRMLLDMLDGTADRWQAGAAPGRDALADAAASMALAGLRALDNTPATD